MVRIKWKIEWTNNASEELKEIKNYIAKDSVKYAERLVKKIFNTTNVLQFFPEMGNTMDIETTQKNNNIRQLIEGNYRIVYEIKTNNTIRILTVHHMSRLIKFAQYSK